MTPKITSTLIAVVCALLASCAAGPSAPPLLVDGQQAQPANYQAWPKFLSNIQRPDANQVREIFMNDVASRGSRDKGFPQGSVFVMENYAAVANADGTLQKGADGNLVKGKLAAVFVMGKNEGWGQAVVEPLRTGNWIYSAYLPSGEKSTADLNTCRACHIPLGASKDWVHRYDQHFDQKKAGLNPQSVVASLSGATAHGNISAHDLRTISGLQR